MALGLKSLKEYLWGVMLLGTNGSHIPTLMGKYISTSLYYDELSISIKLASIRGSETDYGYTRKPDLFKT